MRRIVVTGMGMVSPLASGVGPTWDRLIAGESGVGLIDNFDVSDIACRVAAQIPTGDHKDAFDADLWVQPKDQRKIDRFILYATAGACSAVEDAGWTPDDEESLERTGVMIGSGIGGLEAIANGALLLEERGPRRLSPHFIPSALINLASGHVQIRYGFKGPNHAVVTACSTGAHAIGDAGRLIQHGDADVMVAGGAEAAVCRLGMAGFAAARALSTGYNDTPERASRPWDQDRDGFVMGEGSGIVVLEELEHAKKRGAHIYAELVGYGLSGDAHHITAPAEDGNGGFRSMRAALRGAGLNPEDIDYINAHGT
ncbi:MAG: beta-ketoacyl-ACP synthase II, partial [Alphaproteobacteria bacterium]